MFLLPVVVEVRWRPYCRATHSSLGYASCCCRWLPPRNRHLAQPRAGPVQAPSLLSQRCRLPPGPWRAHRPCPMFTFLPTFARCRRALRPEPRSVEGHWGKSGMTTRVVLASAASGGRPAAHLTLRSHVPDWCRASSTHCTPRRLHRREQRPQAQCARHEGADGSQHPPRKRPGQSLAGQMVGYLVSHADFSPPLSRARCSAKLRWWPPSSQSVVPGGPTSAATQSPQRRSASDASRPHAPPPPRPTNSVTPLVFHTLVASAVPPQSTYRRRRR